MKRLLTTTVFTFVLLFTLLPFTLQAQERKTGAIIDPNTYAKVSYKANLTRGLYTYPAKASVKQFAPYAGDQGQYGTCTAWATAYAAVTIIYAKLNGITDRSKITRSAFSPGFAFRASFAGSFFGCDSGQVTAYVLQSIQTNGVPFFRTSTPSVRARSPLRTSTRQGPIRSWASLASLHHRTTGPSYSRK